MPLYANVIVPLPLPAVFTYRIPEHLRDVVKPLFRVVVPFGGHKFYTAIVVETTDVFDGDYELREIEWCADTEPILRRPQLQLWEWMSDYYMCAVGEVFKAALPSGLKLESETLVDVNPDFVPDASVQFTSRMTAVWEALKEKSVAVKDLEKSGFKNVMSTVYALMDAGAVTIHEKLSERFRPKREEYFVMTIRRGDEAALSSAFARVRSPRHQRLLMKLLQLSDFTKPGVPLKEVPDEVLRGEESYDRTILRSFVSKGFIRIESREVSRFRWNKAPCKPLPTLSAAQNEALGGIHKAFGANPVVLLHGVTSSGKTEIYMHLIDFVLRQNRQVLYLVPEIALTTQLTKRLQDVFCDKVIIYHSRFSDA